MPLAGGVDPPRSGGGGNSGDSLGNGSADVSAILVSGGAGGTVNIWQVGMGGKVRLFSPDLGNRLHLLHSEAVDLPSKTLIYFSLIVRVGIGSNHWQLFLF